MMLDKTWIYNMIMTILNLNGNYEMISKVDIFVEYWDFETIDLDMKSKMIKYSITYHTFDQSEHFPLGIQWHDHWWNGSSD